MKPTTRLEKIEIGRLLEQSSTADDAVPPTSFADEPSVPTVVASLDHLPLRLRAEGSDMRGSAPIARPTAGRERVAMPALARDAPGRPWLELVIALVASAWIVAGLLGL